MSQAPADRPAARDAALTQAWHEASRDEPAPALDDAIRAAARQAVHARPRPAGVSPFGGRWRVPLSVAALVVVSATVTLLVAERDRHGTGALQDQAAPPPAAVRAPEAKTADTTTDSLQAPARPFSEHAAPAPAAGVAPPRGESKRAAPPAPEERKVLAPPASPASTEQPQVRAQSDEQLARQTTGVAASRAEADQPSTQPAQSEQANAAPVAPAAAPPMTRSDAVSNAAGQAPADEAVSGLAKREEQAAAKAKERTAEEGPVSASADASQRAQESSVPRAEPRSMRAAKASAADAAASAEQSLDPKTWLDRILELRRLGKLDEAEKSLKAFRERYPSYPLPPELKSLP